MEAKQTGENFGEFYEVSQAVSFKETLRPLVILASDSLWIIMVGARGNNERQLNDGALQRASGQGAT